MALYEVGKPYHPTVTRWPETGQLRITPGGVELALFMANIADWEVADIRRGTAEFAWIDADNIAVIAWRFGGPQRTWADAPYHPRRDPQAGFPDGAGDDGAHLLVHVVAVDADTGIIAAMRQTTWPPGFACRVVTTVRRLLAAPYQAATHDIALDELYSQHPSTDALIARPGTTTCAAGT